MLLLSPHLLMTPPASKLDEKRRWMRQQQPPPGATGWAARSNVKVTSAEQTYELERMRCLEFVVVHVLYRASDQSELRAASVHA